MAGNKMKTSQAGRNCQKLDDVSPALSIRYRMDSSIQDRVVLIRPRMALVDKIYHLCLDDATMQTLSNALLHNPTLKSLSLIGNRAIPNTVWVP